MSLTQQGIQTARNKKRKITIIVQKQGRERIGTRKTIRNLTHESYSFDDYN